MGFFNSNGKAKILGAFTNALKDSASQALNSVAVAVGETATEEVRIAQGKSKFQFYGAIAWEFVKKHWIWFLVPTLLIPFLIVGRKLLKRKKFAW